MGYSLEDITIFVLTLNGVLVYWIREKLSAQRDYMTQAVGEDLEEKWALENQFVFINDICRNQSLFFFERCTINNSYARTLPLREQIQKLYLLRHQDEA